jgi:hypothetical protein
MGGFIIMVYMSYCRFEGTYNELIECLENFEDNDISEQEQKYKLKLIRLCQKITNNYEDLLE